MVLENYFLSPEWIWAALALIPLIILYLLRPRPKEQTIPSLMFLLRDKKKQRLQGFLQKFIPNILFLLQLLTILFLIGVLVQPYIETPLIQTADETIIVLDDSASMHVREEQAARYEIAIQELQPYIGSSNTVILAGRSAEIVLEQADKRQTQEFLSSWTPSHQPTYLRVALQEALSRVQENTAVIVASDFIDTEPQSSPQEALSALRARAGVLQEVRVGSATTNNIGIIDVQASDLQTTITVKNFDTQTRTTTACVAGTCNEFNLQEQETQEWSFQTPPGISEVYLDTNDAFPIDDKVYIGAEQNNEISVLVVSNQDFTQNPVYQVLQALDETSVLSMNIRYNSPPELTDVQEDLVIFTEINPDLVVQRTMRNAEEQVRQGAASIILYQQGLFALPYQDLLPVQYIDQGQATPVLNTNTQRDFVGLQYASTPEHFIVEAKEQTTVLARGNTEQPLIVTQTLQSGRTMYYGLPTTAAFSASPDYPLFWKKSIDYLLQRLPASQRTRSTGTILSSNQEIRTPQNTQVQGRVVLTHTGVYQTPQGSIVANLNNAQESEISVRTNNYQPTALTSASEQTTQQEITLYLLYIILALLFIEILYLKYRGDI